ncbi:MAG: branched-chain amino acid ABC transporter permease, partial [Candidatus Methylomirabilia bacterium]
MYIALASSWNIISGYTGYVSFGHVAFFGVGAYVCAIMITRQGMPWVPAVLVGGAGAALLSLILGFPCLRLKGPYFAIVMLGIGEIMRVTVLYFEDLTEGGFGISFPHPDATIPSYFAMGITAAAVVALSQWLANSKFGLRLMSIREDELAAEAMGINTTKYKIVAFVLSAFFPGVAGGIYAYYLSYIEPESTFAVLITINMAIMTIFGGRGTVLGPVVGAASLYVMSELVWIRFPFLHLALFGAIIIVVILFMPRGIMGLVGAKGVLVRARN